MTRSLDVAPLKKPLISASLLGAALPYGLLLMPENQAKGAALGVSAIAGPVLWAVLAITSVLLFRSRAWPVLIGFPFAAAPAYYLWAFAVACSSHQVCV